MIKKSQRAFMKNCQILIKQMHKLSLISKQGIPKPLKRKREEQCLNFFLKRFQRLQRISELSAQVKKASQCITKTVFSIESLKVLWLKEEILQHTTAQEELASMAINLLMSKFGTLILIRAFSQWQMLVLIQMDLNSLLFLVQPLI